ncbi:MAG: hypothetical protein RL142_563 [Actinomycetota bacterium]|jgi:glycerophosphoryl diester phosphodiesterase
MSGKNYLSPAKFRIFAHRGTTELGAVENTIQAFKDAVASGADYVETDVQATKDGEVVVFHDSDLRRILGINKQIADVTLKELETLAANRQIEIPRLEVALGALPTARFNIDIKALAAAEETGRLIERFGASDRVLVSSFGAGRRLAALAVMPGVATSADSSRVISLRLGLALRNKQLVDRALGGLDAVQIPTHLGPIRLDSKSLIDACHERGVEVHYWTINDPGEAKRLWSLGADGIVTDRCKLMVMELAE